MDQAPTPEPTTDETSMDQNLDRRIIGDVETTQRTDTSSINNDTNVNSLNQEGAEQSTRMGGSYPETDYSGNGIEQLVSGTEASDAVEDAVGGEAPSKQLLINEEDEVFQVGELEERAEASVDQRELFLYNADSDLIDNENQQEPIAANATQHPQIDPIINPNSYVSEERMDSPNGSCHSRIDGLTLTERVMLAENPPWQPTQLSADNNTGDTNDVNGPLPTSNTQVDDPVDTEDSTRLVAAHSALPTSSLHPPGAEDDSDQAGFADAAVLPADHPLMERFQRALADFLKRQLMQTDQELKQLEVEKSRVCEEVTEQGERQYQLQNQLKQAADTQRKQQQQLNEAGQQREEAEQQLQLVKEQHQQIKQQLNDKEKQENELRDQMDRLSAQHFHLQWLHDQSESRMKIGQRMAERADKQLDALAQDKQFQSYLTGRAESQLSRLQERVQRSRDQLSSQRAELLQLRQLMDTTSAELEMLGMEKRHLKQVWIHSMETMQKKDNTLADLRAKISEVTTEVHTVSVETISVQRSISEAQTQNETLTVQLRMLQIENNRQTSENEKKQLEVERIQAELYSKQQQLRTTETQLSEAKLEQIASEQELQKVQHQIDQLQLRRREAEDAVDTALHQQLATKTANKQANKNIAQLRKQTRLLENRLSGAENEVSQLLLAISASNASVQQLEETLAELAAETHLVEENVNRFEREVEHNNWTLQQKLARVQTLDKKLASLIEDAGGCELGPLELHISGLQRSLQTAQNQLRNTQLSYTKQHEKLLDTLERRDQLHTQLQQLSTELLVMEQRKIRLEANITTERSTLNSLERNVERQRRAIAHLSARLVDEQSDEQRRTADVQLAHDRLCQSVKEVELECVKLKEEISEAERRRQQLSDQLTSCAQLQLFWQSKLQLLREAKQKLNAQDGAVQQVAAMKAEIHRMEVRLQQLHREQERLMAEMEQAVERRENMTVRSKLQEQRRLVANKPTNTKNNCKAALQAHTLKRKIAQAKKDISHVRQELQLSNQQADQLSTDQLAKQSQLNVLQQSAEQLANRLTLLQLQRKQNLSIIVLKQRVAKHYRQLLEGRYSSASTSSQHTLDQQSETLKLKEEQLLSVLEELKDKQPELHELVNPLCELMAGGP